jgi:hypothetical protein
MSSQGRLLKSKEFKILLPNLGELLVTSIINHTDNSRPANVFIPLSSYHASLKTIDKFVGSFIDQALSPLSEGKEAHFANKYTFLHALAEFTHDRKVLRDQIIAVLLAGRDTTAAALSWTFYELARHPKVVEKLRNEITQVVGLQEPPTYEDLKSMKYLQASCSIASILQSKIFDASN